MMSPKRKLAHQKAKNDKRNKVSTRASNIAKNKARKSKKKNVNGYTGHTVSFPTR